MLTLIQWTKRNNWRYQRTMNNHRILIVGDSRVRHLQEVLDLTSLNLSYMVITLPGAKLSDIAIKTIAELSYCDLYHYELVILAGGINNVSKLVYGPTRHAVPRYRSSRDLVTSTLWEMEKAVGKIKSYFDVPVAMASLSGISLVNYSPQYHGKLYNMQPLVDSSIIALNNMVRGLNRRNGLRTPDLSSDVHRCSGHGGHYRTHYAYLYDGLHPSCLLRSKWADKIVSYCVQMFADLYYLHQDRAYAEWNPRWESSNASHYYQWGVSANYRDC